jgi:adenosylcobyric acid synthase
MGLARAAELPVLVVGDIDRGGVLAHFAGTLGVLEPADQRLVAGFVVNKFRGDPALLAPGLDWLRASTGRPTFGVLPWREGLWLDVEDSLDLDSRSTPVLAPIGADLLRVAVIRLPRMSNVTDVDALSSEPGVDVRLVTSPAALESADLVVVPGSRATVSDLEWLQTQGFSAVLAARAAAGRAIIGICGGVQLLGTTIEDGVESGAGRVPGLGLLPLTTRYAKDKVLTLPSGQWHGHPVEAYAIHHGRITVEDGEPFLDGTHAGSVWGTTWHGIFENDAFRRAFLRLIATDAGRDWLPGDVVFADVREARLEALGDLVEEHLDTAAVWQLIENGVPADLPELRLTLKQTAPRTLGASA